MSRKPASPFGADAEARDDAEPDDETASGAVPDMIRRMATLGLSGFFMTESAIRRAFGDTVPREWVDFATEQSDRTRTEVIERIANEMGRQLAETDPAELLSSFLAGHTIEIEAKVRVKPREADDEEDGDGPSVRTRFKLE